MRLAIIDTGTNTFHLLIVERTEDGFKKIFKTKEPVKLGEDGITNNIISEKPFQRGLNAFKKFKILCRIHNAGYIFAMGTAALRRASNSKLFIQRVKEETGIILKIISGNEEAEYIWNGVKHAVEMKQEKSLIMDIGGGSVEFIIANESQIFWKRSYDIGAAFLLEKFKPSDPVTGEEIKSIENFFESSLQSLFDACVIHQPKMIIGSSGSFDTFAELIAHRFYHIGILRDKTTYTYKFDDLKKILAQLVAATREQRMQMKGMIPMRVDMIVVAGILIDFVTRKLNIYHIKNSSYALKEGIMYKLLG